MRNTKRHAKRVEISATGVRVIYPSGGAFRIMPLEMKVESIQSEFELRRNEWDKPSRRIWRHENFVTVTYKSGNGSDSFTVEADEVILDRSVETPFPVSLDWRRDVDRKFLVGLYG